MDGTNEDDRHSGHANHESNDVELHQLMATERRQSEQKEAMLDMKDHSSGNAAQASHARGNEPAVFGYKLTGKYMCCFAQSIAMN